MALTDPDDIIERLTERAEQQIDLNNKFDEDDLKSEIESTYDQDRRRDTLTNNVGDLFGTDKVQDQVTENFSKEINKVTSVDVLVKVPDIASNVRDNKVLQDAVDLKASAFIEESSTVDQVIRRKKASAVVSDVQDFDKLVEQKKFDLVFENVQKEIKDIDYVEGATLTGLANVLGGSGATLTTDSARTIKDKVLSGQTITENDINF